ncbi:MAG TPA: MmgE/PrpD family protein [Alphaproteobacteria bacterium]|jgi:2-methylcitrate dehydratase PrpD|nr:MmgE/PrpD family protein [Alphaproteobacteria bacterium]
MTGATDVSGLEELWARDLSALDYERVPSSTLSSIKLLILDSLATAFAASSLGDGREQLVGFARSQAPSNDCTLLGLGKRGSVVTAAFVNGALVHALNYDALGGDGGHVGLAAVPLPLALGERHRSSGTDLLVAVCAGAEFTCRLAASLHRAGVKHGNRFLEGQVLGYFGASAAAARLLRLGPQAMHDALGFALMQASGTRQVSIEGGAAKALYGGFPNLGAAIGIAMAEQGAEARCSFLEGEAGLYSLFFGGRFDRSVLAHGVAGEFLAERLAFKPWPISSVVQPFVEAALSLRRQMRVGPDVIERIRLRVPPSARPWIEPFAERCRPTTVATASNSIPFCLAKALATGRLSLEDFGPGASGLADPVVAGIAGSIEYSVLESADEISKNGDLVVELRGGAVLTADVSGDCAVPSVDDLIRKFRDCARYALKPLTSTAMDAVVEHVLTLERLSDVRALTDLLRGHVRAAGDVRL